MSDKEHLIPAKPPEVRENAVATPHHTRICRSRCENRPDSQRDYDSKGSAGLRVPLRVVEIDLIRKGIKTHGTRSSGWRK